MVASEFAQVQVEIDHTANGSRLHLVDSKTGRERFLDALELEALVWLPDEPLRSLLDPSAHRWQVELP